ncbi:MAG: hypothetical protein ABIO02_01605, partial [Patescibacteria group bacterium]
TGHDYHLAAEKAREAKEYNRALEYIEKAHEIYSHEGNLGKVAEASASEAITYTNRGRAAQDTAQRAADFQKAKESAIRSVEEAEKTGNPEDSTLPLFTAAKTLQQLGEMEQAVEFYKKAVELPLPEDHKPSEVAIYADIKNHLATCEYSLAATSEEKATALKEAEQSVEELMQSGIDKLSEAQRYNYNVWLSGAYMRIADVLYSDDPEKAMSFLKQADEIIESDERLIARKDQIAQLRNTLRQRQQDMYKKDSLL